MINKVPNSFYQNIFEINYQELQDKGIKTLFFDLDNTLIPYNVSLLTEKVIILLKELEKSFQILIITNNSLKRTRHAVGNKFNYLASAKKPFKKAYLRALELTNSLPHEVAAIGDQLMTDVIGANKFGIYTVLVNPIDPSSEGIPTLINRARERCLIKKIKRYSHQLFLERLSNFEPK